MGSPEAINFWRGRSKASAHSCPTQSPWFVAEKLRKASAQGLVLILPTGARGRLDTAVCPERPLSSALRGGQGGAERGGYVWGGGWACMPLPAGQVTRVNTLGWAERARGGAILASTCRCLHAPAATGAAGVGWGLLSGSVRAGPSRGGARGDWARERGPSRSRVTGPGWFHFAPCRHWVIIWSSAVLAAVAVTVTGFLQPLCEPCPTCICTTSAAPPPPPPRRPSPGPRPPNV